MLFIIASNYFAVLPPQVTGYVVNMVKDKLANGNAAADFKAGHDVVTAFIVQQVQNSSYGFGTMVVIFSLIILLMAILRGVLMFFMRQTIIVMSRHIEFDQKNEIYQHYQTLDAGFFKTHSTGDLMNRITEDVSRVRMYTGPAIMYLINLVALISFCVVNMYRQDPTLTMYVLIPLPLLAVTIYYVNTIINRKSEKIQSLLSDLTTNAQESYSGIRVIKSFVQEKAMMGFFNKNSDDYKKQAVSLAKVEAIYFPSMALMIGLSTLITIAVGGWYALQDTSRVGIIVEFVMYINMLTFPVSAIGWVASMMQRAAASQKRINDFLQTKPTITNNDTAAYTTITGDIHFNNVSFTYPHTGIAAIKNLSLHIKKGEKVLVMGKTGSGKTTLAQLLLRFYEPDKGSISINSKDLSSYSLKAIREQISYVPQDVFLFSESVSNNIGFGLQQQANFSTIEKAASMAAVKQEIEGFAQQYETVVGERGVTLSGGQKQRISIARALIKQPEIILFDDSLSAVDNRTENEIINNLYQYLADKTAIIITHRIFASLQFDKIIVLDEGELIEQGTHEELLQKDGYYAELFRLQKTRPVDEMV
jgi:ATP-binding cassette subfamily B protein